MTSSMYSEFVAKEFALAAPDADLLRLLNPVFPQPELSPAGFHYFTPDEIRFFDALFARFGLSVRSHDGRFDDIEYLTKLWLRLVNGFGSHIECSMMSPRLFEDVVGEWAPPFKEYLFAVINGDAQLTARLAQELRIEDLDTPIPSALFE